MDEIYRSLDELITIIKKKQLNMINSGKHPEDIAQEIQTLKEIKTMILNVADEIHTLAKGVYKGDNIKYY